MANDYVSTTQEMFSDLIKKPKLLDKYLKKPPFRFIHDIVMNTMKSTGFPEGLFGEHELSGKTIKDKQDKISWLTKLIQCIESVTGEPSNAKPNKIVAGIDAELTNQMLQNFASIAIRVSNGELSMQRILDNLNGVVPSSEPEPESERTVIEAQTEEQSQPEAQTPPTQLQAQKSLVDDAAKSAAPIESGPPRKIEIAENWMQQTQSTLGAIISRPRLLDKLLKRPPFRFLFDVVKAVAGATSTGFPMQFLDQTKDIDAADMKDAKFKFYFLAKVIRIVAAANNVDLSFVDPKNVIAGRKPEHTNCWLVHLAKAATLPMDEAHIARIKQRIVQSATHNKKESSRDSVKSATTETNADAKSENSNPNANAKSNSREKPKAKDKERSKNNAPVMPKLALEQLQIEAQPPQSDAPTKVKAQPQKAPEPEQQKQPQMPFQAIQKLQRPRTARRAPPKLKSNLLEADAQQTEKAKPAVILMDDSGAADDVEELDDADNKESARKEDADLERLGFIKDENEKAERTSARVGDGDGGGAGHGKLVRDILDAQSGVPMMKLGSHRKDSAKSVERVENMRECIQKLCQTCLPLGKCIDWVFQDVEAIDAEILKWTRQSETNEKGLAGELSKTEMALKPLRKQLEQVKKEIEAEQMKILEKKAMLLRNQTKTNDIIRRRLLNE